MGRFLLIAILVITPFCFAEDVYYEVRPEQLKIIQGVWPDQATPLSNQIWGSTRFLMDGSDEAYPCNAAIRNPGRPSGDFNSTIVVRSQDGRQPTGQVILRDNREGGFTALRFEVTTQPSSEAKQSFYRAKAWYYEDLMARGHTGAAWFRHQAASARQQIGDPPRPDRQPWMQRGPDENRLYDLFTGGRAISENLQIDRALIQRASTTQPTSVPLAGIAGISVAPMDFKSLLGDANPKLDPLADLIPADQHALFLPSVESAIAIQQQMESSSLPILQSLMPSGQDESLIKRYQRQLALDSTGLARLLGPALVNSIAITGSDPFFSMGTDVAILFQSPNPSTLRVLLLAQIAKNAALVPTAKPVSGSLDGLPYTGYLSDGRTVSSYLVDLGGTLVVSNSLQQIRQLQAVKAAKAEPLARLPEYRFFRNRYPLAQADETALLIISDATIRRWCSPTWRIADARRTIILAAMSELKARNLDQSSPQSNNDTLQDLAPTQITLASDASARSTTYGTSAFLTPILELQLTHASKEEVTSYEQWRDNYQRNWRGMFDPIAIRFSITPKRLSGDLTIMPLIANTQYAELISISQGASLLPDSGDLHDALLHFTMALNRESPTVQQWSRMGQGMIGLQVDPLSWIDRSLAIYLDDDPYWDELAQAKDRERFMQRNASRLPVALRVESNNSLKLAAFIAGVRAMIEQSSPGLTLWETLQHQGQSYVKVGPKRAGRPDADMPDLAVYYAATPDALVISLNENVLKRSLERTAARSSTMPAKQTSSVRPWLGTNVALQAQAQAGDILAVMLSHQLRQATQQASWSNLPILNEWHRRYPNADPVATHERLWGVKLVCPAGGRYVWNEQYHTMESTVLGCPESPKDAPEGLLALRAFSFGNFGLSFENRGLRAKVELDLASNANRVRRPTTRPVSVASPAPLSPEDARKQCAAKLSNIGQLLLVYSTDKRNRGRLPQDPGKLIEAFRLARMKAFHPSDFVCPMAKDPIPADWKGMDNQAAGKWIETNASYILLLRDGARLWAPEAPVLAYEKPGLHENGAHVLFSDGHVEFVETSRLNQLIKSK